MSKTTPEFTTDLVDGLTESEWHRLLAHEQRRVALNVLGGRSAPTDLTELAEEIVAHEQSKTPDDRRALSRAKTTLHHTHLPKMDDLGVISYDPETHRITQCPASEDSHGDSVVR
jgi:hypothetical protein